MSGKAKSRIKCTYKNKPHQLSQRSERATRIEEIVGGKQLSDELDKPCRSKFARDRDRIVFCKSYRRLIHKTQLYLPEHDDHRRTRLTHTLEVVQIARAIAKNLGMNEELVEAIAFGHDIGHAPFGHAGERELDMLLKGEALPRKLRERLEIKESDKVGDADFQGDFKHNYQSVRVLTWLEKYHPDYTGLNLTIQTLEGILKHSSINPILKEKKRFIFPGISNGVFKYLDSNRPFSVTVEGQIVALADEIAQIVHDLDDALRQRVIKMANLGDPIRKVMSKDEMRNIEAKTDNRNMLIAQMRAALLSHFIYKAIEQIGAALDAVIKSSDFIKEDGNIKLKRLLLKKIGGSDPHKFELDDDAYRLLKDKRDEIILNQFDINRMDSKGQYLIRKLYDAYLSNPLQLPDNILCRYLDFKKFELSKNADDLKDWFTMKKKKYDIKLGLERADIVELMNRIELAIDGRDFRRLKRELIEKWLPYMAVDGDFLRCIVDHIGNMTDLYACEEVVKLY